MRYGTMLMDLEKGCVIDLLPVRSAESFASWLAAHPGVEVISRDRSSLYANGGRQGAPAAIQVLERYHLVVNLVEAIERDIQELQAAARKQLNQAVKREHAKTKGKRPSLVEARRQRCREARLERYKTVKELRRQGYTQEQIAEQMGMDAETVARWLNAPEFPERQIRSDRRRDQALFLQKQTRGAHPTRIRTHYSSPRVAALLSRSAANAVRVAEISFATVSAILPESTWAAPIRDAVPRHDAVAQGGEAGVLDDRGSDVVRVPIPGGFRAKPEEGPAGCTLAITSRWNNGPMEGHINRLKTIKRRMPGRAGFELLKSRVLPWDSPAAA